MVVKRRDPAVVFTLVRFAYYVPQFLVWLLGGLNEKVLAASDIQLEHIVSTSCMPGLTLGTMGQKTKSTQTWPSSAMVSWHRSVTV